MSFAHLNELLFLNALKKTAHGVYVVGGAVRDHLLKKHSKDIDLIVQGLEYQDIVTLLKPFGNANLVGKSFGVIKFDPKDSDLEFDIALPRTEQSTGLGHKDFKVNFDPNLNIKDDLQRRDFTINAIAYDLKSQNFIDPFAGQVDLKNKEIKTVFKNSFVEDPLRLLRAVQFSARLQFQIEKQTFVDMKTHAKLIQTVAKERIAEEIKKLFKAPKPSDGFRLMHKTQVLQYVFPDIEKTIGVTQPKKNNEDVFTHTMKVLDAARGAEELQNPGDLTIMLSALFHDTGKPKTKRETDDGRTTFFNHQHISTGIAWRWMKDFKISNIGVNPRDVCHLVKHHMFETSQFHNEKALRRFIRKIGKKHIFNLLDLRLSDKKGGRFPNKVYGILKLREQIQSELNKKPALSPKDLALNGDDIQKLGFPKGPIIGFIQYHLLEKVRLLLFYVGLVLPLISHLTNGQCRCGLHLTLPHNLLHL